MKTENEILEMVFAMFLERGFSAISTNEMIRKAGLTKGGFYYTFHSREELEERVIGAYITPYFAVPLAQMEQAWREKGQDTPTQALLWDGFFRPLCFGAYLEQVGQEIAFRDFYLLLCEGMKKFPSVIAESKAFERQKQDCLRRILQRGQERGEISKEIDLESYLTMCIAMQDGIQALKVLDDTIDDREKYEIIQKQIWNEISSPKPYGGRIDGGVTSAVS